MSDDNGRSPTDIITYIGIPLAILGVIPIFYTSINSVITAYNVRRHLKKNAIMHAATRSSMLSGIIEVEFPVFSLAPLDRDDPDYWCLNPHPSQLKGGSWSIFKWNQLITGKRTYRMQYSGEVKEPQADIDFDELISFLIDRGAVPDAKGFRLLNMAGLWTPANTSLLLSPDRTESVLRIAFPEESDGILSLALQWRAGWATAKGDTLPPHWMLIRDHRPVKAAEIESAKESPQPATSSESAESKPDDEKKIASATAEELPAYSKISSRVRIHLGMKAGKPIVDTVMDDAAAKANPRMSHAPGISLPHLQTSPTSTWLPVFCAALGSLTGYALWTIHIPSKMEALCLSDALPCGVLVMADILNSDEVPSWETEDDPGAEARAFHQSHMERMREQQMESTMSPQQRAQAERNRFQRQNQEAMDRMRRQQEKIRRREREAVESAKMSTEVAAEGVLRLLRTTDEQEKARQEKQGASTDKKAGDSAAEPWKDVNTAAETIIYMMITDDTVARDICNILDRWSTWHERGGLNKDDFDFIIRNQCKWLYYAIILMALLKAECSQESSVAVDLQECVKTWKRVRLG